MWHLYFKNDIAGRMKIAYLHYHLNTGGVTTVIKQQLAALSGQTEQLVLTGMRPQAPWAVDTIHIPELGYSSHYTSTFQAIDAARSVLRAIDARFGGPCDLLHVHNPTLAKNRQFLKILQILQQEDVNLLLQIHDFAEDGRPLAYFREAYPANCHYAVINQRDYHILLKAGLKPDGLHLLENMVSAPALSPAPLVRKPTALYPIRAIRRKNIGETVLLSRFLQPGQFVAITLPPNSFSDMKSYEGWKNFVHDHGLNVVFDQGLQLDFVELVQSSEFLITTSITEGFGFSFLEPWLYGKLLWGRKLVETCRDFEGNGIKLDHLYSALHIPTGWIDLERFRAKWRDSVLSACNLFNFEISSAALTDAFDHLSSGGVVDFGLLDESSQKKVILRLLADQQNSARLIEINPFLAAPGSQSHDVALIEGNKQAILRHYNPADYRRNLMAVYRQVCSNPVEQSIDKSFLVSAFLNLETFSLLKWGDYSEMQ